MARIKLIEGRIFFVCMSYSKYTIKSYEQSLQSLRRLYLREKKVEMSDGDLANVDEIMRLLEAEYPPQTVINFISAILWCIDKTEFREAYQAHGARLKQSIEQSKVGKEHELTFKEQQSFMINACYASDTSVQGRAGRTLRKAAFGGSGVWVYGVCQRCFAARSVSTTLFAL